MHPGSAGAGCDEKARHFAIAFVRFSHLPSERFEGRRAEWNSENLKYGDFPYEIREPANSRL